MGLVTWPPRPTAVTWACSADTLVDGPGARESHMCSLRRMPWTKVNSRGWKCSIGFTGNRFGSKGGELS
jgi:hypothetical protein